MADVAAAIPTLRRALAPGAEARALERLAKDPATTRRMEAFQRAVDRAPDLKTALRDPRVLDVLLTGLGLADQRGQAGLALRALTSDPAAPEGLLARLTDKRWKAAAETLDLKNRGIAGLRDPKVQAALSGGLQRAAWREELNQAQPGVADAMLFRERAARATTAYDLLGDPVLRRVVTTTLGLPEQLAVQSVEAQARAVTSRLDLTKLKDPREVARIAERYVLAAAGKDAGDGAGAGLLALLA